MRFWDRWRIARARLAAKKAEQARLEKIRQEEEAKRLAEIEANKPKNVLRMIKSGKNISIRIDNDTPFLGFQFDIMLQNYKDFTVNTLVFNANTNIHQLSVTELNNGILRMLCYNLHNSEFAKNYGDLLSFDCDEDMSGAKFTGQCIFAANKKVGTKTVTYDILTSIED